MIYKICLTLVTFALFASCSKNTQITYPEEGTNGDNLLAMSGDVELDLNADYSLTAELSKNSELEVKFTNLSEIGTTTVWFFDTSGDGWVATDYENQEQTFTANGEGKADVAMTFMGEVGSGTAIMEIYANSNVPTKTVNLTW